MFYLKFFNSTFARRLHLKQTVLTSNCHNRLGTYTYLHTVKILSGKLRGFFSLNFCTRYLIFDIRVVSVAIFGSRIIFLHILGFFKDLQKCANNPSTRWRL